MTPHHTLLSLCILLTLLPSLSATTPPLVDQITNALVKAADKDNPEFSQLSKHFDKIIGIIDSGKDKEKIGEKFGKLVADVEHGVANFDTNHPKKKV